MDDITENIIRVATSAIRFNNRLALSYNQHLTNKKSIQPIMISKQSMTKSHSGLPSHSCPFWQPSCASRRSAPDGPKRLGTAPTHKAVGRDFFVVCKTAADCHLRPANCVYFMNLLRRSRIRRGRPKPF